MDQTSIAVKANLTGLKTFFDFLHDDLNVENSILDGLFEEAKEVLGSISQNTKDNMFLEHKETIFVQVLRELIANKELLLREPNPERHERGKKVGFTEIQTVLVDGVDKKVELVCIYPAVAISEVSKVTKAQFSKNSLARNLKDAGYLVVGENRSSPSQPRWDPEAGKTISCWIFRSDKLFNQG